MKEVWFLLPILLAISLVACQLTDFRVDTDEYCQIHENHTLCIHYGNISEICGKVSVRGLEAEEKILALEVHNKLRAKLANGLELRGNPGPQPSASNMMQLTWDEELEIEAQTWTDQCIRNHECPNCRTLSRFKVGQNLYWYGYPANNWIDTAINGWYDEVADFNSSYVTPFFAPPGILVGHYTQVGWAQAYKMGCGKLFYENDEFDRSQILFVCNYALAANLLGSEMYKPGEACSNCPDGTECSDEYPGLCSGVPTKPLTIRPPVKLPAELADLRPESVPLIRPGPVETITTVIEPPLAHMKNSSCIHTCNENGGCSVRFDTNRAFSGPSMGSCFSPLFGSKCIGTPELCTQCIDVCKDHPGMKIIVRYDENDVQQEELEFITLEPIPTDTQPDENSSAEDTKCIYNCKENGGCSVKIQSTQFISGNTLGSCFSQAFGGKCSGIPEMCQKCIDKCEGKAGEEFSEPVIL